MQTRRPRVTRFVAPTLALSFFALMSSLSVSQVSAAPRGDGKTRAAAKSDTTPEHADSKSELWWSYRAAYGDKYLPGIMRLNMRLNDKAPFYGFDQLVITGVGYKPTPKEKLPEEADTARLNHIRDQVYVALSAVTPLMYAGSFTYNGQQRYYYYVKDASKVEATLKDVYGKACPGCELYTSVRKDGAWGIYRHFMYPNPAARLFYKEELEKIGVSAP